MLAWLLELVGSICFKGNFLYLSKFSTLRIITFCSTANSCELKHYSDLVLKILRHEKSPRYILPSLTTSLIVICHISKVRALLVEPEILAKANSDSKQNCG